MTPAAAKESPPVAAEGAQRDHRDAMTAWRHVAARLDAVEQHRVLLRDEDVAEYARHGAGSETGRLALRRGTELDQLEAELAAADLRPQAEQAVRAAHASREAWKAARSEDANRRLAELRGPLERATAAKAAAQTRVDEAAAVLVAALWRFDEGARVERDAARAALQAALHGLMTEDAKRRARADLGHSVPVRVEGGRVVETHDRGDALDALALLGHLGWAAEGGPDLAGKRRAPLTTAALRIYEEER